MNGHGLSTAKIINQTRSNLCSAFLLKKRGEGTLRQFYYSIQYTFNDFFCLCVNIDFLCDFWFSISYEHRIYSAGCYTIIFVSCCTEYSGCFYADFLNISCLLNCKDCVLVVYTVNRKIVVWNEIGLTCLSWNRCRQPMSTLIGFYGWCKACQTLIFINSWTSLIFWRV